MKYQNVIYQICSTAWAIMPEKLAEITAIVLSRADGDRLTAAEIEARVNAARSNSQRIENAGQAIAVLSLVGTIIPRGNMFAESSGAVSCQRFAHSFRQMIADPDVGHIVIDIDSPGGSVGGVVELAEEIFNARGQKPITAVANGLAASAAYWIGTAADELVVTPSGSVGSVGVYAAHQDISKWLEEEGVDISLISAGKYKVEGNQFEPLGEEARAAIQTEIDAFYEMFVGAIAQHRGTTVEAVKNGFGQGRVVMAQEAVSEGMADRVATIDEVLSDISSQISDKDRRRRRARALAL